ncbi:hypothetical protein CIB87_10670 [Priestia megaterium]|uniref:DUF3383 family protein n=1 Tax=Priestia megaterium TaxID=1404 RepID=A0AA86I6A7_PRIMG|nr:DUF3383 family protein [Priestia megaterium]AXI29451.1 hypothetical protein CIB87_10670 [Priestia megaterium]
MALQDVTVSIELSKPSGLVGLGKPLIITQKTGASTIKNYSDIEDVKPEFAATTEAYKKAAAILGQENRPASVAIATYDPAGTTVKTAVDAVGKYFDNDWFFVLTAGVELTDEIAVADYVEGKKVKFYAVKVTDVADLNAFKVKNYAYVMVYYHPTDQLEAAAVGALGSVDVGSITWKFKTLAGITPVAMTADELTTIHEAGGNTYVTKAGTPQTSEGITASGEYIDVIHGKSWLKVNIENSVQQAFSNNGKVSFDNRGIALLNGAVTTVLQKGYTQGIIAEDEEGNPIYSVDTVSRTETSETDRAARVYNGLSFSLELAGAIHEAKIKGQIAG